MSCFSRAAGHCLLRWALASEQALIAVMRCCAFIG